MIVRGIGTPALPIPLTITVPASRPPGATRISSAGGRRRAGVPGSLGGRRRPAGRRHGAPAPDPADRRGPAAALLRPPVRRDDLQPVLLAVPPQPGPGRRAGPRSRPPRPGSAERHA